MRIEKQVLLWFNVRMLLGARLKLEREKQGLSRTGFAKLVGITPGSLARIEQGESDPQTSTLEKFCMALGISADYLLGLVPEPHNGSLSTSEKVGEVLATSQYLDSTETKFFERLVNLTIASNREAQIKKQGSG